MYYLIDPAFVWEHFVDLVFDCLTTFCVHVGSVVIEYDQKYYVLLYICPVLLYIIQYFNW